jgi:hypothetical protein
VYAHGALFFEEKGPLHEWPLGLFSACGYFESLRAASFTLPAAL